MSKNVHEPLLADNPNRYVMFPLQDHDIWALYKKMFDCLWRAEEIDFSKDMAHWKTLTDKEQYLRHSTTVHVLKRKLIGQLNGLTISDLLLPHA